MEIDVNYFLSLIKPAGTPVQLWNFQWSPEGDIFRYTDSGPVLMVHRDIVNILQTEMERKDKPGKSDNAPGQQNKPGNPGKGKDKDKTGTTKPETTEPVPAKTEPTRPVEQVPAPEPEPITPAPTPEPITPPVKPKEPKPAPVIPPVINEQPAPVIPVEEPKKPKPADGLPELELPPTTTPDAPLPIPEQIKPEPVTETKPLPEPLEMPKPKPAPNLPAGARIKGDITHLVKFFHADVGPQAFDEFNDGNLTDNNEATNYDQKLKLQDNNLIMLLEPRANGVLDYIQISHGKHANANIKYHAYLKNGDYVENIFGDYLAKPNATVRKDLRPEHRNILAVVQQTVNVIGTRAESLPAEIDFFGEADNYVPKPFPKTKIPITNHIGDVIYDWNILAGSGRGRDEIKSQMLKNTAKIVRWYAPTNNKRKDGKWGFNPSVGGGWWMEDEAAKYFHDNNIDFVYCLKDEEAATYYPDGIRQVVIRYGNNKNVDPKLINIFTGPGFPANEVKVGLGYLKYIQFGNERQRWWKGRCDVKNQTNLNGFVDAFEHCAQDILCYNAVKEIDPTIQIVMSGMALKNPGYILAMAFYAKYINKVPIYGGNKVPWDIFAVHLYNNEKGGQREGAVRGLPPEKTSYRKNIERLLQMEFEIHEDDNRVPLGMVTERGYSHSTGNPEQTAYPIANWDRFEVAGIWNVREILSSGRGYLFASMTYQQCDDTLFKQRPNAPDLGWDLSNGGVDEFVTPHTRRARLDYNMQLLTFIQGYCMVEPGNELDEVVIDRLEAEGKGDLYAVTKTSYDGSEKEMVFSIAGAKSYTVYELITGADKPKITTVAGAAIADFIATEKPTFIQVNK